MNQESWKIAIVVIGLSALISASGCTMSPEMAEILGPQAMRQMGLVKHPVPGWESLPRDYQYLGARVAAWHGYIFDDHFDEGRYLEAGPLAEGMRDYGKMAQRSNWVETTNTGFYYRVIGGVRLANCYYALGYPELAEKEMQEAEGLMRRHLGATEEDAAQYRSQGSEFAMNSEHLSRGLLQMAITWQRENATSNHGRLKAMSARAVQVSRVGGRYRVGGDRETGSAYTERIGGMLGGATQPGGTTSIPVGPIPAD